MQKVIFDRAQRILNELAVCQPASFDETGAPKCLYLPTDTFGQVVGQVLAMRLEISQLQDEVGRLKTQADRLQSKLDASADA